MPDTSSSTHYIIDIIINIIASVIFFLLGRLSLRIRKSSYFLIILRRKLYVLFSGKKYIIIWNDDSKDLSVSIKEKLTAKGLTKYRYKLLNEPDNILYYPVTSNYTHLVLFVVCDVTKISEDAKKRVLIQKKLKTYINSGGIMIGTHDIIYRRCRSTYLQQAFGCEITQFERQQKPFSVSINHKYYNHPLLKNIDREYLLYDGEVTYGEWKDDVEQLVSTTDRYFKGGDNVHVPVVCLKKSPNRGVAIWLSNADKFMDNKYSESFEKSPFTQIVYNAIVYYKDIKHFQAN